MGILLNQKMAKKLSRKEKIERFEKEVKRCLILSKQDREYWVLSADTLSDDVLDDLFSAVSEKNEKLDNYITIALMNDNDNKILNELKRTVKTTKKNIIGAKEDEEKVEAEEQLAKKLKNI